MKKRERIKRELIALQKNENEKINYKMLLKFYISFDNFSEKSIINSIIKLPVESLRDNPILCINFL